LDPSRYEFDKFIKFRDFFPQMFDVNWKVIRVPFKVNDLLKHIEEVFLGLDEMGELIDLSQLIQLQG
jgi:hypothetical protein